MQEFVIYAIIFGIPLIIWLSFVLFLLGTAPGCALLVFLAPLLVVASCFREEPAARPALPAEPAGPYEKIVNDRLYSTDLAERLCGWRDVAQAFRDSAYWGQPLLVSIYRTPASSFFLLLVLEKDPTIADILPLTEEEAADHVRRFAHPSDAQIVLEEYFGVTIRPA